jgi:hypothetical protein
MNYAPVTKLSSFGKGKDSDLANARYISRFGTLQDEMGNPISQKDRAKAVEERLKQVQGSKTSFRVVISLPAENTAQAKSIVEDEIRQRYSSFLVAYHETDDKGQMQPHLHFLIFNDRKKHTLRDRHEIFNLRDSLGDRFQQAGISFSSSNNSMRPNKTQAEMHIRDRGEPVWKDNIRTAVQNTIGVCCRGGDFIQSLLKSGISIARETPNSLTLQNGRGMKIRLNRIFYGVKSMADIKKIIISQTRKLQDDKNLRRKRIAELDKAVQDVINSHIRGPGL